MVSSKIEKEELSLLLIGYDWELSLEIFSEAKDKEICSLKLD